ncbi:right-handed parallel beta-helix repeat-containing protein [Roseateles sp.]|uniref:right-handed parallel beta-helix repeat-containing protein n=1 Tax=Roseateles sp. TaxID=1971397 RepID=UPI0039E99764
MKKFLLSLTAGLAGFAMSCGYAHAQVTIDQGKALAGNVTPGDAPGFPITISQPGSYKLTSNLTVPAGADGIVVAADGVSLDLNGYTLSSTWTCAARGAALTGCPTGAGSGISNAIKNAPSRMTLRNGTVSGFGWNGVVAGAALQIDNLRVIGNGGDGVLVIDSGSGKYDPDMAHGIINNAVFSMNRGRGVALGNVIPVVVRGSVAVGNGSHGFEMSYGSMLVESSASLNGLYGVNGGFATNSLLVNNGPTGNLSMNGTGSTKSNLCNSGPC